jgi:hypothetical protein
VFALVRLKSCGFFFFFFFFFFLLFLAWTDWRVFEL